MRRSRNWSPLKTQEHNKADILYFIQIANFSYHASLFSQGTASVSTAVWSSKFPNRCSTAGAYLYPPTAVHLFEHWIPTSEDCEAPPIPVLELLKCQLFWWTHMYNVLMGVPRLLAFPSLTLFRFVQLRLGCLSERSNCVKHVVFITLEITHTLSRNKSSFSHFREF